MKRSQVCQQLDPGEAEAEGGWQDGGVLDQVHLCHHPVLQVLGDHGHQLPRDSGQTKEADERQEEIPLASRSPAGVEEETVAAAGLLSG